MKCVATHPHRSFWIPIRAPIRAASFSTCGCLERAPSTGLRRNIAESKPDHLAPTLQDQIRSAAISTKCCKPVAMKQRSSTRRSLRLLSTQIGPRRWRACYGRSTYASLMVDPTLRILVKERKVGNDPALSKVNRHCDRVAVRTLTDALSGWDPTIEWYGNILVVRRVLDEVGLSATGAIPPNDRPGSVQIQVIVQHLASVQHSPRIE